MRRSPREFEEIVAETVQLCVVEALKPARDAMKEVCKARMIAFGQAGNAGKIKCKSLADMAAFYASIGG